MFGLGTVLPVWLRVAVVRKPAAVLAPVGSWPLAAHPDCAPFRKPKTQNGSFASPQALAWPSRIFSRSSIMFSNVAAGSGRLNR